MEDSGAWLESAERKVCQCSIPYSVKISFKDEGKRKWEFINSKPAPKRIVKSTSSS
jgi:hypothetical protein